MVLVRGIEEGGKARGDESRPLGVDMVENENAQARAESVGHSGVFTTYFCPPKLGDVPPKSVCMTPGIVLTSVSQNAGPSKNARSASLF